MSEPIVVFYKSKKCRHCSTLSGMWDTPSKDEDSVTGSIRKVHPNMRFFTVTADENNGIFDEKSAPKDLIRYSRWFPMILLVPGKLWDQAMSKLGPKNDVQLVDGVQIINGSWVKNDKSGKDEIVYKQQYDVRKASEFGRWVKDALENEEFKRAQYGSGSSGNVPVTNAPITQPIQPAYSSFLKPVQTTSKYNASGHGDVCSMRIITRPK
jgi:hypothetical protein